MAARMENQIPMGTLAIRANFLTVRQAVELLDEQERLDCRFGEIAVERGILTGEQVKHLLALQQVYLPRISTMLTSMGFLTEGQVRALHAEFINRKPTKPTASLPKPKFSTTRTGEKQTQQN